MQEIKFRAVDLCGNYIRDIGMIEFFTDGTYRVNGDTPVKELLQHTGFNDNNESEVYKGDIVKFTYWWFDGAEQSTELTGVIGFDNASFTLEQIDNSFFEGYTGYEKGEGKLWFGELCFEDADFEVIGNIYENPELFKEPTCE